MNQLLLNILARSIKGSVTGRRLQAIVREPPLVVLALTGKPAQHLIVVASDPGPFVFLSATDPLEGAGEPVLKRIHSAVIGEIDLPFDRVLRLPIAIADNTYTLAIHLYGSATRVRVETTDSIVESLDPKETGVALEAKPIDSVSLTKAKKNEVKNALEGDSRVHGLDRELLLAFTSGETVDIDALLTFRDSLLSVKPEFSLGAIGRLGRACPVPATIEAPPDLRLWGPFSNASLACATIGDDLVAASRAAILQRVRAPLDKYLAARQRLRQKLTSELDAANAFDIGRSEADVLAAYQTQIAQGAQTVELPDLYRAGETIRIKLDPTTSIQEQIKKRYARATKLERSREALAKRIAEIDSGIADLKNTFDLEESEVGFGERIAQLRTAIDRHGLQRQTRRRRTRDPAGKTYRRYDIDGQWFVFVGRNDRENDELTFRVARPDDIWMHAGQVPGSHIVLKSRGDPGNPPHDVLSAAASIAAHYSKARHSKLVPVIYTLRKYVRKFRGSRPGQVRVEREKTIFAEPRLPAEH